MKKNINLDIKKIPLYLSKIGKIFKRHAIIIFLVSVLGAYSFLIYSVNQHSNVEPSQDKVTEQLNTIKRPKIDQETIDKIQQLEDQNVGVKSLFKEARDNPFQAN